MKRAKKVTAAITAAVLAVCAAAFGLAGCGTSELQKQVDELQNVVAEQRNLIENYKQQLDDVDSYLKGEAIRLQYAYASGLVTHDDLLSIAFYWNSAWVQDGRRYNEEIMAEDFVPQPKNPESLDDEKIFEIRKKYCDKYNAGNPSNVCDIDTTVVAFLGKYGDYIVVFVQPGVVINMGDESVNFDSGNKEQVFTYQIDGVVFWGGSGNLEPITAWVEK